MFHLLIWIDNITRQLVKTAFILDSLEFIESIIF